MARYTGPITRKSRRLRTDLVGGDQAFEKRPYPPGQHGRARIKESEYLMQLQEKQKARFTYGVMEKQFRRYYEEAAVPGRPVTSCCRSWKAGWTTSSTARA
jgi:small subunit ribosomal protein S4